MDLKRFLPLMQLGASNDRYPLDDTSGLLDDDRYCKTTTTARRRKSQSTEEREVLDCESVTHLLQGCLFIHFIDCDPSALSELVKWAVNQDFSFLKQ